jgi:hypothetical protein
MPGAMTDFKLMRTSLSSVLRFQQLCKKDSKFGYSYLLQQFTTSDFQAILILVTACFIFLGFDA